MINQLTIVPLKSLAENVFMGVNFGRLSKARAPADKVRIIHVKDVSSGAVAEIDRLDEVSLPRSPQNNRQRLLAGDILLSARGTLMKCAAVPTSHVGAVASANFIIIRLGENAALLPELLWVFLRQPATQAYLLSRVTGSVVSSLNIRALEDLPIPLPPKNIQSDLVSLALVADEQFRCAIECARHRQEEAMEIVAQHMEVDFAA